MYFNTGDDSDKEVEATRSSYQRAKARLVAKGGTAVSDYLEVQSERVRHYRRNLSEEKKTRARYLANIRQRNYMERQKKKTCNKPKTAKRLTRAEQELKEKDLINKRKYWSEKKRISREKMSDKERKKKKGGESKENAACEEVHVQCKTPSMEEEHVECESSTDPDSPSSKASIRSREEVHVQCTTPSMEEEHVEYEGSPDPDSPSSKASIRAYIHRVKKKMPSKRSAWVSTIIGIISRASPKSKEMLEQQGLLVSPKTSEKRKCAENIVKNMSACAEKLKMKRDNTSRFKRKLICDFVTGCENEDENKLPIKIPKRDAKPSPWLGLLKRTKRQHSEDVTLEDHNSEDSELEDHNSEHSELRDHTSEHSELGDHNSEQSKRKDHNSEHSELEDQNSEDSELEDQNSEDSELEDQNSEHSEMKNHNSEHSEMKDHNSEHSELGVHNTEHSEFGDHKSEHSEMKDHNSEHCKLGDQ